MLRALAGKPLTLMLPVALALLFLIASRGAYEGYFAADELDNIGWTSSASLWDFVGGLIDPRYLPQNFRPVGHFFFFLMGRAARLDFRWYVAVVHALHLVNVVLMWVLLRRMASDRFAAGTGALFFAFHMALFGPMWKPMYVFDVFCAAFCLLSLICYRHGRYVLSFLCFWLACKSKEQAVMLPLVLAGWEFWQGERRWKRLVPFFLVSLSFGLQGLWFDRERGEAYRLRLTPGVLARTLSFYVGRLFLFPWAGWVLAVVPWFVRDRRLYLGLAWLAALLAPMLLLPGRMDSAYLYVPLAGVALVMAILSARVHWAVTLVFFAAWLPVNYLEMRKLRHVELTAAHENRAYVAALRQALPALPAVGTYIYDATPEKMAWWGIRGILWYLTGRADFEVVPFDEPRPPAGFLKGGVAVLSWDGPNHKLSTAVWEPDAREESYIRMGRSMPFWQLEEGWYQLEGSFRWTKPYARARLFRPGTAERFELVVNVGPDYINEVRRSAIDVTLDGRLLGRAEFSSSGWQTVSWKLPDRKEGVAQVEFRTESAYPLGKTDPRTLGSAIVGFGFLPRESHRP